MGNNQPFVQSTISAAVLDITPSGASNVGGTYEIPAGMLNLGTRLRIVAWGYYIATTTASHDGVRVLHEQPGRDDPDHPGGADPRPGDHRGRLDDAVDAGILGCSSPRCPPTPAPTGRSSAVAGSSTPATGWTTAQTEVIAPQSVGAQTVAQTATGMITYNAQCIQVGCTVTTATGITSITTNELTCELLG